MTITVYRLPDCRQCTWTERDLTRHGLDFDVVDLQEHPELVARFKEEGLLSAPIVIAGDERWSGLRPDLIERLAA